MDVKSYLSGYADGEGCFCVSLSKSKRHKLGREIRPSFSVSQNRDRMQILKMFREHFGCGHIRQDRSDNTFKYEVRSLKDLVSIVIPHFRNYPLLSEKRKDFQIFVEVCELMMKGKHYDKEGFNKVVDLSYKMNPSGKRRYPLREMMV